MAIKLKFVVPRIHAQMALDLLGRPYWGQYDAGLAEWLKNAKDEYIRRDVPDDESYIVLHLDQRGKTMAKTTFECIDFGGTNAQAIEDALMTWCDPSAAGQGRDVATFGGHGNGGKFHMRDNFQRSYFMTYSQGKLTVMGFDRSKNKNYGLDSHYIDRPVKPGDAIRMAGIDERILPELIRHKWASRKVEDVHFTVVRGVGVVFKQRNWKGGGNAFIKKFLQHPQAKTALARSMTSWVLDGKIIQDRLLPPEIDSKEGYEDPRTYEIPGVLDLDGTPIPLTKDGSPAGCLTLRVAKEPFARRGEEAVLNSIDVVGKVGTIATYHILELDVRNLQGSAFIYGSCQCPVLEDFRENDRKHLIKSDPTNAVLRFIADKVDELSNEIAAEAAKDADKQADAVTDYFNKVLNRWKNKFLQQIMIEVPVGGETGPGIGPLSGGNGAGPDPGPNGGAPVGSGGHTTVALPGSTSGSGPDGGGTGPDKKDASRFPTVLISGQDKDPTTGQILTLDPAQDVVYQNAQHARLNMWWINAQRPLAKRLRAEGAAKSRWRDYLFQRYIDIITTYAIEQNWRPETKPQDVTQWVQDIVGKLHDSASEDTSMQRLLFEDIPDNIEEPEQVSQELAPASPGKMRART